MLLICNPSAATWHHHHHHHHIEWSGKADILEIQHFHPTIKTKQQKKYIEKLLITVLYNSEKIMICMRIKE